MVMELVLGYRPASLLMALLQYLLLHNCLTTAGGTEEDVLISAGNFGGPITLPAQLFSLDFTIGAGVAEGTVFNIDILDEQTLSGNPTSFSASDENFINVAGTPFNGTITIVAAVPEPSSGLALIIAGAGGLFIRRRRI